MIKITPEQQALLEHIKEQITKALEPYVFEPVSSSSLSLMKETINKTLEPIKVQQDRFSDHVYFILDENKRI